MKFEESKEKHDDGYSSARDNPCRLKGCGSRSMLSRNWDRGRAIPSLITFQRPHARPTPPCLPLPRGDISIRLSLSGADRDCVISLDDVNRDRAVIYRDNRGACTRVKCRDKLLLERIISMPSVHRQALSFSPRGDFHGYFPTETRTS